MAPLQVFIQAFRLPFLTGSLMPVAVAAAFAFYEQRAFHFTGLVLTLLGVGALHSGGNLINDYYDSQGSDPINEFSTPFSGGSRVIQEGLMAAETVRLLAFICLGVGVVCGLALIYLGRPWVAAIGLAGLLAAYLYSAAPVQLMSLGLGELTIFLAFGPLLSWGAYYVMTGSLAPVGLAVGLPPAFLITAILWINEFPDMEADARAGKEHLVVRLGLTRAWLVYAGLMAAAFVSLFVLIEAFGLPPHILAGFAAAPSAVAAVRGARRTLPTAPEFVANQALTIQTHFVMGLALTLSLLYAALRH
jgi:1,4-dihydroxy-2-naphthoate octaprenyltransferase